MRVSMRRTMKRLRSTKDKMMMILISCKKMTFTTCSSSL